MGGRKSVLMKTPWNRGGLRTYLVLAALFFARPEQLMMLWGLPLLLCGVVLQVYAKGSLAQDQVVALGGPYRFVRHPFYAANLLIDEGIAVMSGWIPLMLLLPVWWLAVYIPVMLREERNLGRLFPEVYPEYQARVPMLLPVRRPLPRHGPGFSWENANIVGDTVVPRALRILALPLLLSLRRALGAHGLPVLGENEGPVLPLTVMLAVAYGLSWELTRHLRHRRPILPSRIPPQAAKLAGVVLVLGMAGMAHMWEIESDMALPLMGIVGLVGSVVLYLWGPENRLFAEGTALTAITLLCEAVWLAPAPVLLYGALILDERIEGCGEVYGRRHLPKALRLLPANLYHVVVAGGIFMAIAKEVLT